jgi:hypothetical protein
MVPRGGIEPPTRGFSIPDFDFQVIDINNNKYPKVLKGPFLGT